METLKIYAWGYKPLTQARQSPLPSKILRVEMRGMLGMREVWANKKTVVGLEVTKIYEDIYN